METENEEKSLKITKSFYLPISIIKKINYEKEFQIRNNTKEECIQILSNKLESKLNENVSDKKAIVNKYIKTEEKENSVIVTMVYEILENIGATKIQK